MSFRLPTVFCVAGIFSVQAAAGAQEAARAVMMAPALVAAFVSSRPSPILRPQIRSQGLPERELWRLHRCCFLAQSFLLNLRRWEQRLRSYRGVSNALHPASV